MLMINPLKIVPMAVMFIVGYELGVGVIKIQPTDKNDITVITNNVTRSGESSNIRCPSFMEGPGVPTFKTRDQLGSIIQNEGFSIGVELGVQNGLYSKAILSAWPNCSEYHLVDLWGHQENYDDVANVGQSQQEKIYKTALQNTDPWKEKIRTCRNFTTSCALKYEDGYFDFIYVDARHDFKGVWEDLIAYWPKLKAGGIMAGHDYVTNDEVGGPLASGQDWSKNYDGTIDETGTVVRGAVDIFSSSVCRQVTVAYKERGWWTWALRK